MKKIVSAYKIALALPAFSALLFSCKKDNELLEAQYPEQSVYMSQAAVAAVGPGANGIYSITPNIANQAQRFSVDAAGAKMNIPLGIIRAGITTSGTYTFSIGTNVDSVNKLIVAGKFDVLNDPTITTELLPLTAYTLPPSIDLPDGKTDASFNLSVNLSFLTNSAIATPKKRYAIAVGLSNSSKSSLLKTALATTVIFIDPVQVILPVAGFSSYVYKETRTAVFVNQSANGVSYAWNFGDGTPVSTQAAPEHIYAAAGNYTVTLTTTGINGSGAASVKTTTVTIP